VARSGAARKHERGVSTRPGGRRAAINVRNGSGEAQPGQPVRLDALIHHRIRLGIVSALAGTESLSFNALKSLLQTTDGNLSVHARKLEEAAYIVCTKSFEDRRPHTQYRLAAAGRRALQRYLDHMQALIEVTRSTLEG
jgi:DNA-binding HxlR family transcriptional regulator